MEIVFFRVNGHPYGLSIDYLEGIEEIEHITPAIGGPEYIEGIVSIRGEVVPVFDVALKFATVKDEESTSCLLIRIGNNPICLKVDSVEGMKYYPSDSILSVPQVLAKNETSYFSGVIKVSDSELALIIDPCKMISLDEQKDIAEYMAAM